MKVDLADMVPLLRGITRDILTPEEVDGVQRDAIGIPAFMFELAADLAHPRDAMLSNRLKSIGLFLRACEKDEHAMSLFFNDLASGKASDLEYEVVAALTLHGTVLRRTDRPPARVLSDAIATGCYVPPLGLRREDFLTILRTMLDRLSGRDGFTWERVDEIAKTDPFVLEQQILVAMIERRSPRSN